MTNEADTNQSSVSPAADIIDEVQAARYRSELRSIRGANLARVALSRRLAPAVVDQVVDAVAQKRAELTAAPAPNVLPFDPNETVLQPTNRAEAEYVPVAPTLPSWSRPEPTPLDAPRQLDVRELQQPKGDR